MPKSTFSCLSVHGWRRGAAAGLALAWLLLASGCQTAAPDAMRADAYRPVADGREWAAAAPAAAATGVAVTVPSSPPVLAPAAAAAAPAAPRPPERTEVRLRTLRSGDRLEIYLHGIPTPQKLPVVVDEAGYVTMPLIGQVMAAGKTGSELERSIERLYIEQEFYRSVTCVVIPPPIEFFIRGEVRQPGRFPLHRDVTLMQAIILAGGYTEFAQPRRVKIHRGPNVFTVDARRIERGEQAAPPIEPGDIIVVPRRWW